ncbi:MAG: ribosomal L7Ae/L30e/S12e/Gadd45 family protein [Oscillospiraceae bacterium]|nr:ribosomal L7Ae/L30e/S12e/Gadd45 family protein [Oscillospiraceae bacterium]
MNKTLTSICLCRRAGKLVIGFDAVCKELSKKGFCAVVLAADVSEKTEKEIRFSADKFGRKVLKADFTMDEAHKALGKRAGVFLINDEGLFGAAAKHISEE